MVKAQSNKVISLANHLFDKCVPSKFWFISGRFFYLLKVGSGASSNASAPTKTDEPESDEGKDRNSSSSTDLATEESISEFLTQVTTLVK